MKLRTLEESRSACSFCPKLCRHACPAALAEPNEVATPTFKQQVALRAADGRTPLDAERARVLYKCTDCHATVDTCRHRIAVSDSLRDARAQAVREGVAPPEISWLEARFDEHGSPYSADLAAKLEAELPGQVADRGSLGLFPSCTALAHYSDEVRDAHTVLTRAGLDVSIAAPSLCCGYPLDTAGSTEGFLRQAVRVAEALSGFERVVTPGAACAYTLAVRYPQVGIETRFRAAPLVDLLAEHVARWRELAREGAEGLRYAYHDPCFLARRLGRLEEPRAVLRAATGQEVVELGYRRTNTLCSGGGGVYPLTHPEQARSCAGRVADLHHETSADVLVTACPSARRRLLEAAPSLRIQSLVGVLAERTNPSPDERSQSDDAQGSGSHNERS